MEQKEWEKTVIENQTKLGWTMDRNDKTHLGFKKGTLIKDFNKKDRRFVCFDGAQTVNLRCPD